MEKEKLIKATQETMKKIGLEIATSAFETAKIVGSPYDPSKPVAEFIGTLLAFDTVEQGEDFEYFVVDEDVKQVYTLDSNCNVTTVEITPNSETDLTFGHYTSPDMWICISSLLEAKYGVLDRKRETIRRTMDNFEAKKVIDLIDAAVPVANEHTLQTGTEKFNYDDLCAMVEDVANYGEELYLVMGTNVHKDVVLWNFDNDKNQAISVKDFDVTPIVLRGTVKIDSGSVEAIMDADVAYLVATSDAEENKPGYFVRRKVGDLALTTTTKERVIINSKPIQSIGANRKMAFAIAGYESFGSVITNANTLSKFTRV